jgi:hypothetical protein
METFNWEQYLLNYPDLVISGINNKYSAWRHYIRYGRREKRSDAVGINLNTTHQNLGGRFGNVLFYNLVCDYFAKVSDLCMRYKQQSETENLLKLKLFSGTNVYKEQLLLTDDNIDSLMENPELNKNLVIGGYFQTPTVARYIRSKITPNQITYNLVFVHVRLGDITGINETYEYYHKALSMIPKTKGFISSDSPDHEICQKIMKTFNLKLFCGSEVETITFGSMCKYLVLSKGTFSWWTGVLSSGEVYYPGSTKKWHGDIFVFSDWKKIIY